MLLQCQERLQARLLDWRGEPSKMYHAPPSLAFAVIGQARSDGLHEPGAGKRHSGQTAHPLGEEYSNRFQGESCHCSDLLSLSDITN
jgi:hypothetical protein